MRQKLKTQEILQTISNPDCKVRCMTNPYLEPKKVLVCDMPNNNNILDLSTTYIFKHKLLEMTIIYKDESVSRIIRPDAKWHRPVVNDMLGIYHAIIKKYENQQKQK